MRSLHWTARQLHDSEPATMGRSQDVGLLNGAHDDAGGGTQASVAVVAAIELLYLEKCRGREGGYGQ